MASTDRLHSRASSSGETSSYKGHAPLLSTVAMVEHIIKETDEPLSKTELWKNLPRKVMYQTFKEILEYLEASNKIIYDKSDKIVWVAVDNPKLEEFFRKTVKLR